jgi:hypothetical protein
VAAGLLACYCVVYGATVHIAWEPPIPSNNVVGYQRYHGPSSRYYTVNVDLGGPADLTNCTIPGLNQSNTYYFALTAYNSSSNESAYSAELVWDNTAPIVQWSTTEFEFETVPNTPMTIPDLSGCLTMSDNFSHPTNMLIAQTPAIGMATGPGMLPVEMTVTDEAGNVTRTEAIVKLWVDIPAPRNFELGS